MGQEPTAAETAAFVADDSADAWASYPSVAGETARGTMDRQAADWRDEIPRDGRRPDAAKKPRVATTPGRYVLGEGVQLQVTQISSEGRRENKAQILFVGAGSKKAYDIALP